MFSNLVDVAKVMRADLTEVYWLLLIPLVCGLFALEFLKEGDEPPQGGRILKRVVISILLLITFNEVVNIIGMLGDGIIERIDKISSFKDAMKNLGPTEANLSNEWFNLREHILYAFSLIAYIIAYLGFFVAEALTQFVWVILYTVSPLMILAYVPVQTANVTANLYKGLVKVVLWKIMWTILGALLLKMAMEPSVTGMADWIMSIVMNFCIGLAMLFVPMATRSLINDGMEGAASALSAAPALAAGGAVKGFASKAATGSVNKVKQGLGFAARPARNLKDSGVGWAKDKSNFNENVERPVREAKDWYSNIGKTKRSKSVKNNKPNTSNKNFDERDHFISEIEI